MAIACYAGCIAALSACGDDDGPSVVDGGEEPMADGGMRDAAMADGGRDGGGDVCEGRTLCTAAGTSCSGNAVVTCAEDADGCLVETRSACTGNEVCEVSGSTASCVDPCDAIPAAMRCDVDGARSCEGDTLSVCAPNTDGCLVLTETDCTDAPGGVCNPSGGTSGDMPVCAMPADPCADVPADERCTTAGTSCSGDELVVCAPNAFGCLVETTTDCTTRDGGACDDSGEAAVCTATDPCAGITQCAAEGTSCSGPELVTCAPDAFGCLVETAVDCTSAAFGFCDVDATPAAQCSTAAVDPCMGVTQCGTELARSCSADTLEVCAPNAFGCFVSETTDCAATEEVCSDAGEAPACVSMCPVAEAMVIDCATGTITGTTVGGSTAFNASACRPTSSSYAGAERVYRFRHTGTDPQNVAITVTRTSGNEDMDLFAIAAGDQSLGCSDTALSCLDTSNGTGAAETVEFAAFPGELTYVLYDVFSDVSGTAEFTLEVTCTPSVCGNGEVEAAEGCDDGNTDPADGCDASCQLESGFICTGEPSSCYEAAPNATCAGAQAISGDTTLDDVAIAGGGPRPSGSSCGSGTGVRTLYYEVTIPPAHEVVANVPSRTVDLVVMEQSACSETGCTAQSDIPERLTMRNETGSPVTRIFAVRPYGAVTSGTFDLTFTYSPLCGNGSANAGEECDDGNSADSDGCSSACALESGYVCTGTPSICAIAADNATCATAQAITSDTTLDDVQISGGGPRPSGSGCGSGSGVRTLYYEVTIPPAHEVVADVPSREFDIVVMAQSACSETGCVAQSDAPERLTLANTSDAPVTRIFAVRPYGTVNSGTFDLTFAYTALCGNGVVNDGEDCDDANSTDADGCTACAIDSGYACHGAPSTCALPAPNGTCDTAAAAADGTLTGDTRFGGPAPTATDCGANTSTPATAAVYYTVTVPAGATRIVTLDPTTSWDGVLFELEACDSAACSSNADDSASGGNEVLVLVNSGATDATHIIGVQAYSGAGGPFTLTVAPPPYTATAIASACVDVSSGVTVVSGDDNLSTTTALPFAFSYFGTEVTHYRASSNGYAELSASSPIGGTSSNPTNSSIPAGGTPNGVLAPFWDDLVIRPGSSVRALTTGSAGDQRLVLDWDNAYAYLGNSSDNGVTVHFQVHLFEATGVVEFHYCSMTNTGSSSRHTGSSATIGIENLAGSDGVLTSYDTADAVMTGSGFRYTPN